METLKVWYVQYLVWSNVRVETIASAMCENNLHCEQQRRSRRAYPSYVLREDLAMTDIRVMYISL